MSSLLVSVSAMMMLPRRSIRSPGKSVRPFRAWIRQTLLRKLDFGAVIQSIDSVAHNGFTQLESGKDRGPLTVDGSRLDHAN